MSKIIMRRLQERTDGKVEHIGSYQHVLDENGNATASQYVNLRVHPKDGPVTQIQSTIFGRYEETDPKCINSPHWGVNK